MRQITSQVREEQVWQQMLCQCPEPTISLPCEDRQQPFPRELIPMGCLQCWEHFWPDVEGDKQPPIPAGVNVSVSSAFLALGWEMLVKTEPSRAAPECWP